MYKKILNTIGIKRMPPLLVPFGIPFIVVAVLGILIFMFVRWLVGFWQCKQCEKFYWITHDRKASKDTEDQFWQEHLCDACVTMNELTKSQEPDSDPPLPRGRPAGRPITRP
ncbi:MAG: hypothetical protein K0R18_270 [Bacillales bacterium]|jgi:hypothetical protein|nr:hypothetical protein [Bacillales bacterium]